MTITTILKYVFSAILTLMGLACLYGAHLATTSIEQAIFYANLSILNGESIMTFLRPIGALLSGGHLKVVDNGIIYSLIVAGWLLVWIGCQFAIFTYREIPFWVMLTRKFWTALDFEIIHRRKYREDDLSIPGRKRRKPKHATPKDNVGR